MLLLVRHGRTDANAQGLLLGRADPPLSEEGRAQAAALAAKIPEGARVIASPLLRTRQTAEAFGRPVELDERWIELDYGELDGLPLRDVPPICGASGAPIRRSRRPAASRSPRWASVCGPRAGSSSTRSANATSSW